METLEGAEKPVRIGWVKSGAIVTNVVGEPSVARRPPELDTSGLALRGKFPRIAKQILQHNSDQMGIDERLEAFFNAELHPALRLRFLQLPGHRSGDRTKVRVFPPHLGTGHSGKI